MRGFVCTAAARLRCRLVSCRISSLSMCRMVTQEEQFDLWTTGPIIDAVSQLQLYPDSKTYV